MPQNKTCGPTEVNFLSYLLENPSVSVCYEGTRSAFNSLVVFSMKYFSVLTLCWSAALHVVEVCLQHVIETISWSLSCSLIKNHLF